MNRRGFFGRVVGGVAAVVMARRQTPEAAPSLPRFSSLTTGKDGTWYRHIQAERDVRRGWILCNGAGNEPIGVAMSNMKKGQFGWVAISGPGAQGLIEVDMPRKMGTITAIE